jgi:uncharacterized membrane protein
MTPRYEKRKFRSRAGSGRRRPEVYYRPLVEQLEDRVMLDAGLPQAIVVGRTLSSYFVGSVQNNQETITLTVYNEQAKPVTGVLVTDTLQPGVTFQSASQLPDQSGQNLAWSLGTINGFDRASVALTVSLANPIPLQLDAGAHAFATLDAGMVSNSTPAVTLRQGTVAPGLLASTPDANTTDPFIQEQAAALGYNAPNIFNFLHNDIGYNSYFGSVRGARGTLWSAAGNALDVASLGVALMRASGIPAQYVQGTLPFGQAQNLILSMFQASYQLAGYIPAGTQTADPAHDPQLLAETEAHYWFQFDTGTGFQDADPLIGSFVGSTFTSSQGTFNVVPDNLREKTEVTVQAEIYSQANAAFGGTGLTTTSVLDQTFNDVDLVGRPLTFGNFVSSTGQGGLVFSTVTNTYSPYLQMGDDANDSSQDQLVRGQDYQEILTNFPLGSQYLTGLFLNFTLTGPQGAAETYSKTLVDRIGFTARQAGGTVQIAPIDSSTPPVITPFDLYTISILASGRDSSSVAAPGIVGNAAANLQAFASKYNAASAQEQDSLAQQASQVLQNSFISVERSQIAGFEARATVAKSFLSRTALVASYGDRPRITIASSRLVSADDGSDALHLNFGFDLLKSNYRIVVAPGQSVAAQIAFNTERGYVENSIEGSVVSIPSSTSSTSVSLPVFTGAVFEAATTQGVPLIMLSPETGTHLDQLPFSPDVIARVSAALSIGKTVIIPTRTVTINDEQDVGWYEVDLKTGATVGMLQDGSHGALLETFYSLLVFVSRGKPLASLVFGSIAGFHNVILDAVTFALKHDLVSTDTLSNFKTLLANAAVAKAGADLLTSDIPDPFFIIGYLAGAGAAAEVILKDPPVPEIVTDVNRFGEFKSNRVSDPGSLAASSLAAGVLHATESLSSIQVSGQITATWSSSSISGFQIMALNADSSTVLDSSGHDIGSGTATFLGSSALAVSVNGNDAFSVSGSGTLSFFGPAETTLGVSGNWDNYAATITGNLSLTLMTDGLRLNGLALPAGTYTIATTSATLTGSGASTSPNFSGSASITTSGGTVDVGPGNGSVTIDSSSLNPANGVTLTGYTGGITVAAGGGNNTDAVTLNGNSDNVLAVSGSPVTFTTDQNTPVTFQANVQTSFADTYTLTAQAPTGWTVSIDNNGNVTATPAPGLQSGTYPIQIIAQSTTNPDLVAQAFVSVTIKSTSFGITLNVAPDQLTTVPFNGAQLPTAFVASIHNSGPIAATENLVFSNIPSGFTLVESATSVRIPAGQTGSVGVYFVPTSQIPAPGSQFSFHVSASDIFGDTAAQTVSFTMPEVHGVTLTSSPPTVDATPGVTATDAVTITAVGNVPETVTLSSSASSGLTVGGLSDVTLQPGQSVTENVALTPDASTPLDTLLAVTLTATFGPAGSPQTTTLQIPVDVVVPGALATASAAASATQLGEKDLAARLNVLGPELTNLVLSPTSAVFKSQVLATLDAIIGLLAGDVFLPSLTPALTGDRARLAQAATAADVNNALATLGNDLGSIATTLSDEIAHALTLQLDPNQGQARPQVPVLYPIAIQNTGNQATTYDFSVSGLPTGVTASFNDSSVTLQPGQYLFGGPNGITLTLTETGGELTPTSFSVIATAVGAPEINRSAAGSFTVRSAFVQVTSVTPSPSFTNAGGKVDVTARILNITANPLLAQAFYTVSDPGGNVVFTSTPVSVPFTSFVSFPTVDLGSFDTTGLAQGSYTISVMVTDAAGNPLTNVIGQSSIVVGSPVTASLSLSSSSPLPYFPFTQSLTNTLKVDAQTSFPPPLTLAGFTATDATETSVALDGTLAYVGGTKDVSIVDVHDPNNPMVLGTFGSDLLTQGGYNVCKVAGNLLLVASQNVINTNFFNLLIYSISNPLSPTLVSNTQINYHFIADMFVEGTTAFFPIGGIDTFVNVILTDQFGDFLAVDFSNPAQPRLADVLFNNRGAPDGGDYIENGEAVVNSQLTYVASTTSKGSNSQVGSGELLIVNTSDPTHLAVAGTLIIPDTVQLIDVAIEGNRALAVGSTGGVSITSGAASEKLLGDLTLTPLDISDPLHPRIVGPTLVTQDQFFTAGANPGGKIDALDLGNGIYAISDTQLNGNPVLLLVNASDPNHMIVGATQTSSPMHGMTVSGNLLYASSQDGLSIYNIGQVVGDPVTVSVEVPTGTAVTYDPTTFNIAPSQVVHGAGFDTVTWISSLGAGATDLTLTWTSKLASNQPPETLPVALGATVDFINQGTSGTLTLPGTFVTVPRYAFLAVTPASRTVQPGASAAYTVAIQRSKPTPIAYNISVVGLPAAWVSVPATVTVPANSFLNVPLNVLTDPSVPLGTYNFTVVVTDGTVTDSQQVSLILQGQPVLPTIDPDAHGVVTVLTPAQASAGQGTSASYVVQVTNTGSADDRFTLSAAGLPAGVSANFAQTTIDVPPGASNFRDVTLTLTPQSGTAPGGYSFTVMASSITKSSVSGTASGALNVLGSGVSVALNPPSAAPGSTFQMTVTNTGQVTDTFDLALAGPAALVSQLASSKVTLAPGGSQVVSISSTSVNFAVPGALELAGLATSEANAAVQAEATANLSIPVTTGMTASFSPTTQVIPVPGSASFLVLVNNIGNTEEAYTASIVSTTGSVSAGLTGLTGQATQSIPLFRLPGLSTGAILLQASLAVVGQGTVTVQVQSLTDGTIIASPTATLVVNTQPPTANNQSVTTAEGPPLALKLTGSDPNTPALPLTYVVTSGPAHGTLTGTTPNLTYTPNAGYFGLDSFTYQANNPYLTSNTATVSIDVIAPPTASNSSVSVAENTAQTIPLTASDPNSPAQPLTYIITSNPAHGTLSAVSGNTVIYTPSANFFGPDSFQFKVNNGTSDSQVATLLLTVLQPTLTVTVSPATRVYGQANPTFTDTITGFVNGDNAGVVSGSASLATSATASSGVGNYTITAAQGSLSAANYTFAFVNGTLSVTPAILTVTANDASKVYGAANPSFSDTITGFVNGDTSGVISGSASLTTAATASSGVGTYTIAAAQGSLSAANYTFTFGNGTLTITPAILTVTADDKSKVYGTANPALTDSITGFVNGDGSSVVGGSASLTTSATASSGVGSYSITTALGSLSAANYTFAFVNGTLTVTPALLTVTADDKSKVYGAANPTFSDNITGFVNGDGPGVISGSADLTTSATASSGVGTYTITAAQGSLTTANYTFTLVDGTLTITPVTLTVTANDAGKVYGAANPTFTDTITGLVNGDDSSVVSGLASLSTTATAGSGVGTYTITAAQGSLSAANYSFTFGNGTLTITPATLTVTADDKSKVYGSDNPALTDTITGFVNGDGSGVVSGSASLTTSVTASSGVGTYTITAAQGSLSAANYGFAFVNGTLTVTPATLTVAADNKSKVYGAANPTFSDNITGFVNGDTSGVISGSANLTTSATASSGVGSYTIIAAQGSLSAANYSFAFGNGTLTINPAATSATLASSLNPSTYGQAVTFTATVSAVAPGAGTATGTVTFKDGNTVLGTGSLQLINGVVQATFTTAALSGGSHTITAVYGGDGNFTATTSPALTQVVNQQATSSLSGLVFEDFNDDGQVDFGEQGIAGVSITLSGTDDLGNSVRLSQKTDAAGTYLFANLRPGSYTLTETQPAGYGQGIDSVGTAGGSLAATDQFFVQLGQGVHGLNYNYGERPPAGAGVQHGQTAGIGFWNNHNGQALIKRLNGGTGHQLGDWLAATLPNMYGASAGSNNLAGKSNADIAAFFQAEFSQTGPKLDAQVLATALSVYVTNATLDSTQVAAQYGFTVSGDGVGTATFNVGTSGDAFGVANNSTLTVMDLLLATDAQAVRGVLYNGNSTKRHEANTVYSALNDAGGIS